MFQISRIRSISSSGRFVSCLCQNNSQQHNATTTALFRTRLCLPSSASQPQQQKFVTTVTKKSHFSSSSTTSSSSSNSSSATPSWLEGDIGALGTTIYHNLNLGLAVIVPIYFLTPERYTNGYISKTIGFGIATGISLHTYIGLNYVCRDYVPKISSKLLGPARIVTAGFSLILFVGMSKIALFSPNGIKGIITGLWTKPKKSDDDDATK